MSNHAQEPEQREVDGKTIKIGMPIVDQNGNYIGTVKEFQEHGFLVDRSKMHFKDLFIPYWVCFNDSPGQVKLEISQIEVNQTLWRTADYQE